MTPNADALAVYHFVRTLESTTPVRMKMTGYALLVALCVCVNFYGAATNASALFSSAAETAKADAVKGRLCFSAGRDCTSTRGMHFNVAPAESLRRYVWTSDDQRSIFAGTLAAGASAIDLTSKEPPQRHISLRITGHAIRSWPADVEVTIWESRDKEWKLELPAEIAGDEIEVHLPAADYVLFVDAPRHMRFGRRLPSGTQVALGTIELQPLPSIRGRVIQVKEERVAPVIGAQIFLGDGSVGGSTNEQGLFSIELSEPLPKEIVIASAGAGAQVIKLEKLAAEHDLGEIRLASGAKLTLQIERPEELLEKRLSVRLLRHDDTLNHLKVATTELPPGADKPKFPDLSPGQYYVVVEGEGPLERLLVKAEMGQEDLTKKIAIRPFRLEGSVLLGEEPIRKGQVEIMPLGNGQQTWRTKLKIEEDGSFGGVLWQPGRLQAFLHGHGAGGVLSDKSPELGTDPSIWTISFKERFVYGRILDAKSGEPPSNVILDMKMTGRDGGSRSNVSVSPDGKYRVLAWRDGIYDLIVSAPEYLAETKTIELTELQGSKELDFALKRGSIVELEFFWTTGEKILSPRVYEGVTRDGHQPERIHQTNPAGILTLTVPPGSSRLLYVLPWEGSFSLVRVAPPRSSEVEPTRVEIPPKSGTLRVRVKDRDGNAAKGIIGIRYNGEWIPYAIASYMGRNSSDGLVEFQALPAGVYELWAIADGKAIPAAAPAHAPVRVSVNAGETNVEATLIEFP